MNKGQKVEILCLKTCWALIIVSFISTLYFHVDGGNLLSISLLLDVVFLTIAGTLCIYIYKYCWNAGAKMQDNEYKGKYEEVSAVCNDMKQKCKSLEKEKIELESRNRELLGSVAEYFTLQQVSQAISSILDIKELLKYVNDVIIGVMGVSHSTVILYDEKKKRLMVSITSVVDHNELAVLMDNINNPVLINAMENDSEIIENNVDCQKYEFTKGREIKSLICAPINTKSRKFGLVIAEQRFHNAFNQNNGRILSIIGQQVGFAMENAELYKKMQDLATIDGLTGIYNRHYFHDRLQKEFKNAFEEDYDLSLIIFDIDHFKKFNDTYGHLFGDKVLRTIVDVLKVCIRNTDVFARFGGEEFIILLPRTELSEAYEKAEILRSKVSKSVIKDDLISASVTVSFGIASFPENATTENELIRLADDALYEAKNSGRNCVVTSKISANTCQIVK